MEQWFLEVYCAEVNETKHNFNKNVKHGTFFMDLINKL